MMENLKYILILIFIVAAVVCFFKCKSGCCSGGCCNGKKGDEYRLY